MLFIFISRSHDLMISSAVVVFSATQRVCLHQFVTNSHVFVLSPLLAVCSHYTHNNSFFPSLRSPERITIQEVLLNRD